MTDYYAVLGVRHDADEKTIKARYRKLAKENHPDLHPEDKAAEARFKDVGEAWEILGDAEKRQKYDESLAPKTSAAKQKSGGAPMGTVDYADLMGRFDSFFGKDVKTPNPGQKPQSNPLDATELFEKFMGIKKK
jgi:molecular chaperone DnaJ